MTRSTLALLAKLTLLLTLLLPFMLPIPVAGAEQSRGERLFLGNCAECHQADGRGMPNVYPALAGNETVLGSGADVALVLIIGRGEMPSFAGALSSEDMAAIINYVRNSWGNSGAEITAQSIDALQ